jgi:light-regulated signal transduction histidine kinase (bacteriophytochrome)
MANRELESFSYSVSHDLRAPLATIDGFSRLLSREYAEQLPEQGQHFLRLIHENAGTMQRLIDDLLAFSRSARQPLKKEEAALGEIVAQALEELRDSYAGRQVEIVVGDLPLCRADPTLVKQVYVNLLSNAIKFTRPRAVARIEIGTEPCEGCVAYYVKDNGVGFDPEQAEHLFGVFQRLHSEDEYEGTGVGLAIVERIVKRHGGRVWADAAVDQGATFYFTLP